MVERQLLLPFEGGGLGGHGERNSSVAPSGPRQAIPASRGSPPARGSLFEQVVREDTLDRAWKRVRKNRGAPGVDGMTVDEFPEWYQKHGPAVVDQLLAGTYVPLPVRRVETPKPGGGVRLLGVPTVLDRVIQQAIVQVLTPILDPTFSEWSFGFRPSRSAHDAVRCARQHVADGHRWVVDVDLSKFFDRVNHDVLMSRLARRIEDRALLRLIRRYLDSGVMLDGVVVWRHEGTPQGGPLSPLLSNVLLDEWDRELECRGHKFARYADDCVIYVRSRRAGERVMASCARFLEGRLRLKVNAEKSAVARPWKRGFLGFSVTNRRRPKLRLDPKSVKRMKDKVREITRRRRGVSLSQVVAELNRYLRGWLGYFRLTESPSVLDRLSSWIRRRLRCFRLKQWRGANNDRRRRRGRRRVPEGIPCSTTRLWRLSKTENVDRILNRAWFDRLGLIDLRQEWTRLVKTV